MIKKVPIIDINTGKILERWSKNKKEKNTKREEAYKYAYNFVKSFLVNRYGYTRYENLNNSEKYELVGEIILSDEEYIKKRFNLKNKDIDIIIDEVASMV